MDYKIAVNGYLKSFLQTQLNGLTGHIEMAGYPFDRVEWGKPDIIRQDGRPSWWVYEQTGYWLDGFTRCAILINDHAAIERARAIIYPNYNICVNGQWAYGVGESCTVKEEKDGTLSLEAYKIANWKLCRKKRIKVKTDGERGFIELYRTGDFLFTPSLPKRPVKADEEKTIIQLVPYGQTLCRITVFPCV